ncbi:iron-sulfur cluster repair di-iron protein [Sorangium sp. So ce131]|uniref:iron-sulfur cluster repair di-iron protein n=1 Tax=Sorangium sp. So ce131 TaxID=3133282 RepID=UPI003F61E671
MSLNEAMTVAEVVGGHPECARVFSAHKIDFCCGGKATIAAACAARALDAPRVLAELEAAVRERSDNVPWDFRAMSTPGLIAHVVDRHHGYLRQVMPQIRAMAAKVARVHGARDARLAVLDATVRSLCDVLLAHLDREEQVLFPALLAPVSAAADAARDELRAMEHEHEEVGAALAYVRALADDFAPPGWACGTYKTLLRELEHMESDVHQHVHLENNVLMPRFVA